MIEKVERMAVQQLVGLHRAQLVEVLPRAEFEWAHLPGAIHLHLKKPSCGTEWKPVEGLSWIRRLCPHSSHRITPSNPFDVTY